MNSGRLSSRPPSPPRSATGAARSATGAVGPTAGALRPVARAVLSVAATIAAIPAGPPPLAGQELEHEAPAQRLEVGVDGAFSTISAAVAAARPGDTVVVQAGEYAERLRIDRPMTLVGQGWPVIDAGGTGHVIEATAAVDIRGFVIRGSGIRVDAEDAGLMVRDASAHVEDNRFQDVFYGIYLKNSPGSVVRANEIVGKPLPRPRRGDGIRLWASSGSVIDGNRVTGTRDVVIFFSDSLEIRDNIVTDGRYGLHYMYSHHNRFLRNRFERNEVGAFIMYSTNIELRDNVFSRAAGLRGMGLGLKDADAIRAIGNMFVANDAAIYLDNSPLTRGVVNTFSGNLVFNNGVGVRLLPAVNGNVFEDNDFVDNRRPVEITGGGAGRGPGNRWNANYWSSYAGFDGDDDGFGDTPFVHARIADEWVARHPALQIFAFSPAVQALDVLSRFFPLLQPQPVVVDSTPRARSAELDRWAAAPPVRTATPERPALPRSLTAAAWAGLGLIALGGLGSVFRPRGAALRARRRARAQGESRR
jgi:nitrous oxidase accessory protein